MIRKPFLLGISACVSMVLITACTSSDGSAPVQPTTTPPPCTRTPVFIHAKNKGTVLYVTDVESKLNNDTARAVPLTLTNSQSQAVTIGETTKQVSGVTASADVKAGFSLPIKWLPSVSAEAKAIYSTVHESDWSARQTVSTSSSSSQTILVPAGATGYVFFGVEMRMVRGVLQTSGCSMPVQDTAQTVFVPEAGSYCAFTRGPDVFVDGGYGTLRSGDCQVLKSDLGP